MVQSKQHIVLLALAMAMLLGSCHSNSRQLEKARALYEQGLMLSTNNSVAAAESYSQALIALDRCNQQRPEVRRL